MTMIGILGWPASTTATALSMEEQDADHTMIRFYAISTIVEDNGVVLCWSMYLGH